MGEATKPLISIGMPVYNEEPFLAKSIESLLVQDHSQFELIIADNHSTDGTGAICREYAARDSRVRYVRNRTNLGSRRNLNLLFELSRGQYFMWAHGHDIWDKEFLARTLEVMESDPEVVLCHAHCALIDTQDQCIKSLDEVIDTRGLGLVDRMKEVWRKLLGPACCGLIRTSALDQTRLNQDYAGCDVLLLLELSAIGSFAFIETPLFFLRQTREEHSEEESIERTNLLMNPFSSRYRRPYPTHILDYMRLHLRCIHELDVDEASREELFGDLIDCYRVKFGDSALRAANAIRTFTEEHLVLASPSNSHTGTCETLLALDYIRVARLLLPDNESVAETQQLLLELAPTFPRGSADHC